MRGEIEPQYRRSSGLVDVLDRVLDKGLVVAGDIRVGLAEVELLTIRIRLLVCSIDKAEQIGLDWWRYEPHLTGRGRELSQENDSLRERIRKLEDKLAGTKGSARLSRGKGAQSSRAGTKTKTKATPRKAKSKV